MARKHWFWIVGGAAVLGLGLLAVVMRAGLDTRLGYHAPIFDSDGLKVLYIERETTGFSWGLGYEFFSPPAHAWTLSDRFRLRRLDPATGRIESLREWPPSPLEGRWLRTYRGRLYTLPSVRLRHAENGALEYAIRVSIPTRPRSEIYGVLARWNNQTGRLEERSEWSREHVPIGGYLEDAVAGEVELMAPPGPDYYPSAILLVDHGTGEVRVLLAGGDHQSSYPDGVAKRWIEEHSHAPEVNRLREMRGTHGRLVDRFRRQGMREGEALLSTGREMQRLGYYPKTPTLTARLVAGAERGGPVIEIPPGEMQSGVFPDIERAIASPGTAVDKRSGRYLIHHDYQNSRKLNALLATDIERFWVRYQGRLYEMVIERP